MSFWEGWKDELMKFVQLCKLLSTCDDLEICKYSISVLMTYELLSFPKLSRK
jgi:hypothetical protein